MFNKCAPEELVGGTAILNPSATSSATGFSLILADRWAAELRNCPFSPMKSREYTIHSMHGKAQKRFEETIFSAIGTKYLSN